MSCSPPRPTRALPRKGGALPASAPAPLPVVAPPLSYGAAFAGDAALERQLQGDSCILTAEVVLEKKLGALQAPSAPTVIARIGGVAK